MYSLGKVLGRGQFGTTRLAVEKATGAEYACKSISKRKLTCALHAQRPTQPALPVMPPGGTNEGSSLLLTAILGHKRW